MKSYEEIREIWAMARPRNAPTKNDFNDNTNPDKDVQLVAVNNIGHSIQYIEKPAMDVQLAAVNKNAWAIKFIEKPDKEVIELVYHLTKNIHLVAKYIED